MRMKRLYLYLSLSIFFSLLSLGSVVAQERRPIDNEHPLWMIHIDVWNQADPQKIIDLIPADIRPYVCMNLSLSCSYKTEDNMYERPRYAVRTYRSWASVCQQNGLWFTCQPASGGHTHIQDNDLETFEYFFKTYPNFLGWNYAEQFWGFNVADNKSSATDVSRWALFAKLVEMSHKYGGFLTVSWCGGIYHMNTNPIAELKRNKNFLAACQKYPEAILFLYKYTHCSSFYNNESVCWGPFVSGLTKNYGVRYDNCGWNDALMKLLGENHNKKYPGSAGIGTVMEQTCVNGGAVWDGPELIWREECFQNLNNSTVDGYTRRNWGTYPNFKGIWLDMWRKIIDGTMYIPTREEILDKTKIVVINDKADDYTAWDDLYDGVYKQNDPFNRGNGRWEDNLCYFKSTGRYGAIPIVTGLYDDKAKAIPVQVKKSNYTQRWGTQDKKMADFNEQYPEVSTGDLYVNRYRNQLVTYTPYSYMNSKKTAQATIPLRYNTCEALQLNYAKLSSGIIREYADHIDFYLNNYRSDTTAVQTDVIVVTGVASTPSYKLTKHSTGAAGQSATVTTAYDAEAKTFTLNVKHMGPLDLTINCQGDAVRDAAALPIIEQKTLPMPKQPEPFIGPIIIEAENMDYKSVQEVKITPFGGYAPEVNDFSALGFVRMGTSTGGALRHQLKLKQGGNYVVKVRYCNASKEGTMKATINGTTSQLKIEKCSLNDWRYATVNATLKESNDLVLANSQGINMLIDQIVYEPEGTPAEKFKVTIRPADNGSVSCDVDSAVAGQVVKLRLNPSEGYGISELRVVSSVFYTQGWVIPVADGASETTFVMPEDNVTIQPVFYDNSSIYALDYTDVQNGTFPEGWRTIEGTDVRSYPYSAGSGPRSFVGFTGYQGKALYWRNGSADYGRLAAYPLTLEPGNYKLTFAMAAWKGTPTYKANILNDKGSTIASSATLTAAPNANGNTAANVSTAKINELSFEISQKGKYVIQFLRTSGGYDEYLLLECRVKAQTTSGISQLKAKGAATRTIYDVTGKRHDQLQRGLNIVVEADGTTRKVLKK